MCGWEIPLLVSVCLNSQKIFYEWNWEGKAWTRHNWIGMNLSECSRNPIGSPISRRIYVRSGLQKREQCGFDCTCFFRGADEREKRRRGGAGNKLTGRASLCFSALSHITLIFHRWSVSLYSHCSLVSLPDERSGKRRRREQCCSRLLVDFSTFLHDSVSVSPLQEILLQNCSTIDQITLLDAY